MQNGIQYMDLVTATRGKLTPRLRNVNHSHGLVPRNVNHQLQYKVVGSVLVNCEVQGQVAGAGYLPISATDSVMGKRHGLVTLFQSTFLHEHVSEMIE